jgi:hypothetical protein
MIMKGVGRMFVVTDSECGRVQLWNLKDVEALGIHFKGFW